MKYLRCETSNRFWAGLASVIALALALAAAVDHFTTAFQGVDQAFNASNMKLNTAVGLGLSVLSILLLICLKHWIFLVVSVAGGVCVAMLGALTLAQDVFGVSFGIDEMIMLDVRPAGLGAPGRMAPTAAFGLALIGGAIFCVALGRIVASQILSIAVVLIACFTMTGYLFGVPSFYRIGFFTPMAPTTGLGLLLLSLGLMAKDWQRGLLSYNTTTGGRYATLFLLPWSIVMVVATGMLIELAGLTPNETSKLGVSFFVMGVVATLFVLVLVTGHRVALAERRELLLRRELRHRLKNNLSVAIAIVRQTARTAPDVGTMADKVGGRITALADALGELDGAEARKRSVRQIVEKGIEAFATSNRAALKISGDDSLLELEEASGLALTLHELATNATKYGALSVPQGRVQIEWATRKGEAGDDCFVFEWTEQSGPPVCRPERDGFGGTLIQHSFPGADIERDFAPEGLRFSLRRISNSTRNE
jgi:two-component sensor histidine kinase